MEKNKCLNCEGSFDCVKSKNNKTRKFCCFRCYNEYKKINQVKVICSFCGKSIFASKKRSQEIAHCSRKCYIAHAVSGEDRRCKKCGELKSIKEFALHVIGKPIKRRVCHDCFNKDNMAKSLTSKYRWQSSKSRCLRTDQIWDISFEDFEVLIKNRCHYCDGELNKTGCGLDRKNNNLGYIAGNVVPCCKECNAVKNSFFTYEDMMLLSPVLKQIRRQKDAHGK